MCGTNSMVVSGAMASERGGFPLDVICYSDTGRIDRG